jgi:hypothetical protein
MSDKLMTFETNAETGETIERELNDDELAEWQELEAQSQAKLSEQEAKTKARASALAKLAELGLTAEEIAAL